MAYNRESATDNHLDYPAEMPDIDASKRPDWVNLTSLDGQYESLFDKMLYKTVADQARIKMHMALKAAAAADEKPKGEIPRNQSSSTSLQDSLQFNQDKREDSVSVKEEFTFGTAGELRLDPSQRKPVIVDVEKDHIAHPSLYADPEEKLDRWIQKLTSMRRKKLEGEALAWAYIKCSIL